MNRTGVAIDQTVIFSIPVFPDPAKSSFPLGDMTAVRAELTLDFSSFQRGEIRRDLCLDEALLCHLCLGSFGKAKEAGGGEHAETRSAKFQEFSFRHLRIGINSVYHIQ